MFAESLLHASPGFEIDGMTADAEAIILTGHSVRPVAICPICRKASSRVHSRYCRRVADLPWAEKRLQICLRVRRFFCDNDLCKRKTFAEQFPAMVARYARRTNRLAAIQQEIGLAIGGEPAARILTRIAMPASGDTVLRLVRRSQEPDRPTPTVLGIDDWAWRKGQSYGTILVDLERHRVVDLLEDRLADTLAAWLKAHPGVAIISRDRAPEYIKGSNQGAPDAVQVADRWHLLRNLRDALVRILEQNRACLYAAASDHEDPERAASIAADSEPLEAGTPPLTKAEQMKAATRERRLARYQAITDLAEQGANMRAIARQSGMSRRTIGRYLRAGDFPEMAQRRKRPSILDPYLPHLRRRWMAGCRNGTQLYREVAAKGFRGSCSLVRQWAAKMRREDPESIGPGRPSTKRRRRGVRPWSAQYAVWLLLKDPEALADDKRAALQRMLRASPAVACAHTLAQAFLRIVRERLPEALEPWLKMVLENRIPELSGFARSLNRDIEAVVAALSLPWSNGQVEGQVNRLKLIKRQMYGRAKFDLLRLRVLAYSGP
jgi:transposase